MSAYVEIDGINRNFDTVEDAVEYMETESNEENASFDITIRNASGDIVETDTIERGSSGDFIYSAWYICIKKYDEWECYDGIEFNTAEDAAAHEIARKAIADGYEVRADRVRMTLSEKIDTIGSVTIS